MPSNHSRAPATALSDLQVQPFFKPSGDTTSTAGYAAGIFGTSNDGDERQTAIAKAAAKVMQDPLLMRLLSERVYQLLLEDLQNQRERSRNYGGYW